MTNPIAGQRSAKRFGAGLWQAVPLAVKLVACSALLVVMAVAVGIGTTLSVSAGLADDAREREISSRIEGLESRLAAEQARAESMVAVVADMPQVQAAMAGQDRQLILDTFTPGFAELKERYGVEQFQFHLPPAISFARVHKPESFGDDLSGFRQTVVAANASSTLVAGVESGVAGIGMRAVAPVVFEGRHVGTVEFGLSMGQSFLDGYATEFGVDAALWVPGEDGTLEAIATTTEASIAERRTIEAVFTSGEAGSAEGLLDGSEVAVSVIPVRDFAGNVAAVVPIAVDVQSLADARADARQTGLLAGGAVLAIGLLLALAIARNVAGSVTRPVGRMGELLRRVADGDLTQRAVAEGSVEVRRMAGALNQTLTTLQESMSRIDGNSRALASASVELSSVSGQMTGSAQESASQAEVVSGAADQVSRNVQTVATGTEEMSASIREIAQNATAAADVAAQAVTVAESTTATVAKLGESSSEVGDVIKVINAIAEQTNLLALNATIEAARAGEAGKGFAVVAHEVKELAGETSKATEDIGRRIEAIQADTEAAVAAIGEISEIIARINDTQGTIASAVEEQTATTNEMSRNVAEAASGSSDIAANITGVATTVNETTAAAASMSQAAEELARMATEMQQLVDRFQY